MCSAELWSNENLLPRIVALLSVGFSVAPLHPAPPFCNLSPAHTSYMHTHTGFSGHVSFSKDQNVSAEASSEGKRLVRSPRRDIAQTITTADAI